MGDLNYISCIVRILEIPYLQANEKNIFFTKFRVQLPQICKQDLTSTLLVTAWGYLANKIVEYYQINDYLLIEGYISFQSLDTKYFDIEETKCMSISIQKIVPFLYNNYVVN